MFRFSQWISHSEKQSVSVRVCVCIYRLIYVSTTRISIRSVHSQLYMDDQYCPVPPPSIYQQVSSTGETLDSHGHDNLQVSSGWETGCLQRALSKADNNELSAHHLPYQPCLCLGCQNPWTIKIATFRHKNKVSYVILSSPFGNILTMLIDKMHTVFHRIWKTLGEIYLKSAHRLDGNNDWKKDRGATVFIGWCKVIFFGSQFDDS